MHSNACHNFEISNKTTTQVLLHRHIDDEFCTNCSSCGGQVVTGDSLTLQRKDPSADQYGSLPMVLVKCPTKQRLCDTFLASETFVFYIQFLQNAIQYTTNNFPNMSAVQFLAQADCFFQTLLQSSSETHPVSYPKTTLSSYCDSKFPGTVTVLRLRICKVLMSCLQTDSLQFIQGASMTESITEAIRIRTPHTKTL